MMLITIIISFWDAYFFSLYKYNNFSKRLEDRIKADILGLVNFTIIEENVLNISENLVIAIFWYLVRVRHSSEHMFSI